MNLKQGQTDQFDDLINDPEGASVSDEQTSESAENMEDDWSVPVEEPKSEESDKDPELEADKEIDKDSDVKKLDNKKDEEDKDKEDDKKDKEDEKEDKKEEDDDKKEESEEKQEDEPKIEGKSVKIFKDGKKYEIPEDGTVKVKSNGKSEKVTIADLKQNWSGQQAWDKKITEAGEKNKEADIKLQEVTQKEQYLESTVNGLKQEVEQAISKGDSPMSAINKIVDLLGYDSYDFNEVLFESMFEEFNDYQDMTEAERRAYKLEKKTDYLTKRQESFESQQKQMQAQEEHLARVDSLREAHDVSEEEFVHAVERLESIGKNDLTPEQVITYASNVKYLEPAEELLSPYEDQLSDEEFEHNMKIVANTLKTSDMSKEAIAKYLAEQFVVEDAVNAINKKAETTGAGETKTNTDEALPSQTDIYRNPSLESFEDLI